jgi:hypothetical protein
VSYLLALLSVGCNSRWEGRECTEDELGFLASSVDLVSAVEGSVPAIIEQRIGEETVPLPAASWIQRKLGHAIVRGPEHLLSQDGTARVARFWLRLQPGMSAAFPLGMLGEIGLEAVG